MMELESSGAMKEAMRLYVEEMEKILPETDDDLLLEYHEKFKRRAIDHFLIEAEEFLEGADSSNIIGTAIEMKFLDVLDSNWQKCESVCRKVLDNLTLASATTLPGFQSKSEACQTHWWNHIKNIRAKYSELVGELLVYQMPHIWLEHLNERQKHDYTVILGDIMMEREKIEELEDMDTAISNSPKNNNNNNNNNNSNNGFNYQPLPTGDVDPNTRVEPNSDFCLEMVDKQLRLQMTWGRVFLFWKYWVECRKDTTEIFERILDAVEDIEQSRNKETEGAVEETIEFIYQRLEQSHQFRTLPLIFAKTLNKDFQVYGCLIRKLRDFFDSILKPDFVCAFDMNPASIFEQTSRFQCVMKTGTAEKEGAGFRLCAMFLENEQDASNMIAVLFRDSSRPLVHLKTFLVEIANKTRSGDKVSFTLRRILVRLSEEERNWSDMLSDSIDALLTVAGNVTEAIPQLRSDIRNWSPQRDETIAQLRPIIEKLHETTKNVAITQTVSSSVGIVGGAIAIGGLIMAPFTMGASLIPTAIAGGVVSGVGAVTAIGASVTEIFVDKDEMKKAAACLQRDKMLFQDVANQIKYLNLNSGLLLRYIPQDELESFIGVITDPKSKVMKSFSSSLPPRTNAKIALNLAGLLSFGGKAVLMPVSRLVLVGTIAASRVAVLALAHGVAAVGVALDVANLIIAGVKLGKGARSESAERLEEVVKRLEAEKRIIDNCLNDICIEF